MPKRFYLIFQTYYLPVFGSVGAPVAAEVLQLLQDGAVVGISGAGGPEVYEIIIRQHKHYISNEHREIKKYLFKLFFTKYCSSKFVQSDVFQTM